MTVILKKCSRCGELYPEDQLEDWGEFQLCPKCVEFIRKIYPEKIKEASDKIVKIHPHYIAGYGSYDPSTGEVRLKSHCNEAIVETTLTHESIHYVIHKHIGLRACFQYDNIAHIVE